MFLNVDGKQSERTVKYKFWYSSYDTSTILGVTLAHECFRFIVIDYLGLGTFTMIAPQLDRHLIDKT